MSVREGTRSKNTHLCTAGMPRSSVGWENYNDMARNGTGQADKGQAVGGDLNSVWLLIVFGNFFFFFTRESRTCFCPKVKKLQRHDEISTAMGSVC